MNNKDFEAWLDNACPYSQESPEMFYKHGARNAWTKAQDEIVRLKNECKSMGNLISKSICVPKEEYVELNDLKLDFSKRWQEQQHKVIEANKQMLIHKEELDAAQNEIERLKKLMTFDKGLRYMDVFSEGCDYGKSLEKQKVDKLSEALKEIANSEVNPDVKKGQEYIAWAHWQREIAQIALEEYRGNE